MLHLGLAYGFSFLLLRRFWSFGWKEGSFQIPLFATIFETLSPSVVHLLQVPMLVGPCAQKGLFMILLGKWRVCLSMNMEGVIFFSFIITLQWSLEKIKYINVVKLVMVLQQFEFSASGFSYAPYAQGWRGRKRFWWWEFWGCYSWARFQNPWRKGRNSCTCSNRKP